MIYVEDDDEVFPDMDDEEPIYRSVAAFDDLLLATSCDDMKSTFSGMADMEDAWVYRSPSDPFDMACSAPENVPASPAVSRGSSSHHDSANDSARHEQRASHAEDDDDLDDLLRTWASLRVENDKLQQQTREIADSARLLATINEEMTATLQVRLGDARAAAPSTPGSSATEAVASLSRPIPGASPPELGSASKRPRSFTSEYTAEQLHPQKLSSDANGLPQGGAASVGQLRELVSEQRRRRDELLRESRDNASELSVLQQLNTDLRQQLEQLRSQVHSLRSSD